MRILVAEDDVLSRTLLVRVLSGMGHDVVATSDGDEAWTAFRREPFPVVVTDWLMPRCDGLELTRRIRSIHGRVYPWIVMLTGMDFAANYRQTMEAGVDDFLVKPLDAELLRVRLSVAARVQRMCEQVAALTSALPICMHCKAVRDAGDNWKRVEEYFSDIDFSHSYCPDCYYEHSLRPELQRLLADPHWSARLAVPDENATLDARVLQTISDFEAAESPDLVHDLVESFVESSDVLRQDLYGFGASGLLGGEGLERVQRFATRCTDLGLGRLAGVLKRVATLKPEEQLAEYVELANAAAAELDVALSALGAAREGQPTGR